MAPNIPTNDSQISNFIEDEVKKIDLKIEEENQPQQNYFT